jgi:hypothetical protein
MNASANVIEITRINSEILRNWDEQVVPYIKSNPTAQMPIGLAGIQVSAQLLFGEDSVGLLEYFIFQLETSVFQPQ